MANDNQQYPARARVYRSTMNVIDGALDMVDINIRHTSHEDYQWQTTIDIMEPLTGEELGDLILLCSEQDPPVVVRTMGEHYAHLRLTCRYVETT